jgi:hypothetical protein
MFGSLVAFVVGAAAGASVGEVVAVEASVVPLTDGVGELAVSLELLQPVSARAAMRPRAAKDD